jgi:hypothetical protein
MQVSNLTKPAPETKGSTSFSRRKIGKLRNRCAVRAWTSSSREVIGTVAVHRARFAPLTLVLLDGGPRHELDLPGTKLFRCVWAGDSRHAPLALYLERRLRLVWRPSGRARLVPSASVSVDFGRSTSPTRPPGSHSGRSHSRAGVSPILPRSASTRRDAREVFLRPNHRPQTYQI